MSASQPRKPKATDTSAAVERWMSECTLPQKPVIEALRKLVCSVSPAVKEGIKWNSPSFWTSEYFATVHLRMKPIEGGTHPPVGLILHLGAKKSATRPTIEDPKGLVKWLADDRALVTFADLAQIRRNQAAVKALLDQWIRFLP